MRFLNTATHPGTLFSKIRRGSREDGLSGCDEVDELTSLGPVSRPQTAPGTRPDEMKSHKTKNGELTGYVGVHIPSTPTFEDYQYGDLIPLPDFNSTNGQSATRGPRRRKATTPEPLGPRQITESGDQRDFKPPTPPKTPTEVSKTMTLPSGQFPLPPRKDSRDTPGDLTALPSFQSPKNESLYQPTSPSDVSPKSKERLFIVPDDELMRHGPVTNARPSITARVSSPNLTLDKAPLTTTLTHRPTIKSRKSSVSLKLPTASPGPPPKGPLPDLPPVAREKELIETNRLLRAHIEILMEHLRRLTPPQQQGCTQ